ncbi:MAG: glycosyltransferase, partial [Candidatus Aminicenantes bacterium]|nr:glycosyltransferase [Candidatus Aminicenantes bacterium]
IISIKKQHKADREKKSLTVSYPTLNIIIPCFNEEKTIRKGIPYLKEIDYPHLNITIINDGSKDRTLDILKDSLALSETEIRYIPQIPTQGVKKIYLSSCGKFVVVDKFNGGKADTLNTGINLTDSDLVCCVDADTIIKKAALKKIVMPFLKDDRVVAAGGSVRIKNDSDQLLDFPNRLQVPEKMISTLQAIEYIRSINISRNSLALFNANLIISGAFGVFKTSVLREIGGYEKFSKGEDLELLTRIHFFMLKQKKSYKIAQIYSADSFTNAPESFRELKSQRKRWQVGLVSTLRTHFFKFFRYPFSPITFFSLPYYILFEVISPIVQLIILLAIPVLTVFKLIHLNYVFFLLLSIVYSSVINIFFLILDFCFSSYYRTGDKLRLLSTSLIEPFFYHQLNCYWKLLGTTDYMKKVFVRATWTPPRGDKDYKSQIGKMSMILNPDTRKGLNLVADYKSLYRDGIIILVLSGSFEASDLVEFEKVIHYFRQKKRKKFILDLKELDNISSEALSMMIGMAKKLKKEKGKVCILNARDKIRDEFMISNAVKEIKIFKNYSDAINEVKYG